MTQKYVACAALGFFTACLLSCASVGNFFQGGTLGGAADTTIVNARIHDYDLEPIVSFLLYNGYSVKDYSDLSHVIDTDCILTESSISISSRRPSRQSLREAMALIESRSGMMHDHDVINDTTSIVDDLDKTCISAAVEEGRVTFTILQNGFPTDNAELYQDLATKFKEHFGRI